MIEMPSPERAFAAYRPLVEGYEQAMPMLLWSSGEKIQPCALKTVDAPLADQLQAAFPDLIAMLGRPDWVVVSVEAWTQELTDEQAVANYRHGDAERARKGGDATVGEAVFIVGVSTEAEWYYRRSFARKHGSVQWAPTAECDSDPLGGVADALRELVRSGGPTNG